MEDDGGKKRKKNSQAATAPLYPARIIFPRFRRCGSGGLHRTHKRFSLSFSGMQPASARPTCAAFPSRAKAKITARSFYRMIDRPLARVRCA